MSTTDDVVNYLKRVNPAVVERAPDVQKLKLRRVLDSLDMAEFITHLENTYSMKINDQDILARNFETVATVIEFLDSRRASA